ncbi:hypothetical protein HQ529_01075 [Candidatus Woesearchaeota archaeon]|nr:hypothetical protein [Candidatus Woesearchaeota archaeon]
MKGKTVIMMSLLTALNAQEQNKDGMVFPDPEYTYAGKEQREKLGKSLNLFYVLNPTPRFLKEFETQDFDNTLIFKLHHNINDKYFVVGYIGVNEYLSGEDSKDHIFFMYDNKLIAAIDFGEESKIKDDLERISDHTLRALDQKEHFPIPGIDRKGYDFKIRTIDNEIGILQRDLEEILKRYLHSPEFFDILVELGYMQKI